MFQHEDTRRRLIEWATAKDVGSAFRECKVVIMKAPGVLGNHWHANKDETFLLLQGFASKVLIGGEVYYDQKPPQTFFVPRGAWHEFHLEAGSVLLGAATELFDKNDERKDAPPKAGIK